MDDDLKDINNKNFTVNICESIPKMKHRTSKGDTGSIYPGYKCGYLTALRPTDEHKYGTVVWEWQCDCGKKAFYTLKNIKSQVSPSCGCQKKSKAKDITGQKAGYLTAIRPTEKRKSGAIVWEWQCDCGKKAFYTIGNIRDQRIASCGCQKKSKVKDITGQKIGYLTAIRPTDKRKNGTVVWEWRCDCGKKVFCTIASTRGRIIPSCGCQKISKVKDITGLKIGYLTAINLTDKRHGKEIVWEWQCDCGKKVLRTLLCVKNSKNPSCGCKKKTKAIDITGEKIGYLTAVKPTCERKGSSIVWEWKCECGNKVFGTRQSIKARKKQHCGCQSEIQK